MKVRNFRTAGGGIVMWTYTHDNDAGTPVGTIECTGCHRTVSAAQSHVGNDHAAECRQIP